MAPWILALLAGIGVGVTVTALFWDDIKKWLADFLPKVANVIRQIGQRVGDKFEHVAMIVAEKLDNFAAKIKHKLYFKEADNTWTEQITQPRRGIPEENLPPEIQAKLRQKRGEVDITENVAEELQLTVA